MMRHLGLSLGLGCVLFALVGCGGGGPPKHRVTGTVTLEDGSPLTKGMVIFASPAGNARGQLDAQGNYSLGSAALADGALAGSYQVFLAGPIFEDDEGEVGEYMETAERSEALVHPKFSDPKTSGLTCEVKGPMTFDIKVEKP
jgi:hypothetical protein